MGESLSQQARKNTEELILQGILKTGAKITERDLADRLGMSRAPVREAIRELINVGLLDQVSARQIIVRQLEVNEVKEIFHIREILESKAASLASANITVVALETLEALQDSMQKAVFTGNHGDYFDLNIKFHYCIHAAAKSPRLATLIDQIMRESLIFRSRILVDQENIRQSLEEHEQLLKSIQAKDCELSGLLMSRHIQGGFERLDLV